MTPGELRGAALRASGHANVRSREATELGGAIEAGTRAAEAITGVWTSPAADRLEATTRGQLIALRATPDVLEDARGAMARLSETASELASELQTHLDAAASAAATAGSLRADLAAGSGTPDHDQRTRERLSSADSDHRAALDRADAVRARWDTACRAVAWQIRNDTQALRHAAAAVDGIAGGSTTGSAFASGYAEGERIGADLRALLDGDIADHYDDLVAVLARLEGADEAVLAGLFGSLDADQFQGLLLQIHDAHQRTMHTSHVFDPDFLDRTPTQDLLEPLSLAFAEAARRDLLTDRFVTELVRSGPTWDPDGPAPPTHVELIGQLLIHGDPMGQGNPLVTARLAEVVLHPQFLSWSARSLGAMHSPYHDGDPDRPQALFDAQWHFYRALDLLAASPEASHLFITHPPNQTALLDHASEGLGFMATSWGPELEGHMAAIIEQGLLTWPAEMGHFEGRLPADLHDGLVHLIGEVGARDRIPASLAPALAAILLPHLDTFGAAVADGEPWRHTRPADLDLGDGAVTQLQDYLAVVARHDDGYEALVRVTSDWTVAMLTEHGDALLDQGAVRAEPPGGWLASTHVLRAVHGLVGEGLHQAGQDRDAQMRFYSLVLGEASSQLRGRAIETVGLGGGVKGYLVARALSWADGQATPLIEEAISPSVTSTADHDALLAELIPHLATTTLLEHARVRAAADPLLSFEDLVPVAPGTREVAFPADTNWLDRAMFWRDTPDELREVGIDQWTTAELAAWVDENRVELGISTQLHGNDDWWLAWVIAQYGSLYREPYGGGSS